MGIVRSLVGFIVVVLLTISLVSGNVVTAADRTVLDQGFVTETLEEEEAYGTIQTVAADEAEARVNETADSIPVPIDPRRAVRETLTRAYLKNQTEANINRTFRYLGGEEDRLDLRIDLRPVKDNVADLAETRIRELSVSELIDIIVEAQELSVTEQGVTFDLRVVANMSEGPQAYNESREEFRANVRQVVVNSTYDGLSNDERLLLIGENPEQYDETEKERIVEGNESEIKDAVAREIVTEERVNQQLSNLNDAVESGVARTVNESIAEQYQPVAGPATEMLMVGVNGLTTNMSYESFDSNLSRAKSDLAGNVSTVVRNVVGEEFRDQQVLTEDLSPEQERTLQQAREGFGTVGLLGIVLPIVSLGLIGLLYLITRSLQATAFGAGFSLLSAGGSGYAVATITPGMIEREVESELAGGEIPREAIDLALGIVEQVLGVLGTQSLLIAGLGVVSIVVGVYLRVKGE